MQINMLLIPMVRLPGCSVSYVTNEVVKCVVTRDWYPQHNVLSTNSAIGSPPE